VGLNSTTNYENFLTEISHFSAAKTAIDKMLLKITLIQIVFIIFVWLEDLDFRIRTESKSTLLI
jgi:hypothetical protein